jgi:cysteine-rich repeat protein
MPLLARLALAALLLASPLLAPAPGRAGGSPATFRGSRLIEKSGGGWCSEMRAAGAGLGLEGKHLMLKANGDPKHNELEFKTQKHQEPLASVDPTTQFRLLVTGSGGVDDRTELISLRTDLWKQTKKGWKYKDKEGSRGGVREVTIEKGQLKIRAKGEAWSFDPDGDAQVSMHVRIGNNWYCSDFGGTVQKNEDGLFKARDAAAPVSCGATLCGNEVQEVGEACDDGDLDPEDGCANDCTISVCQGDAYATTFEAIQNVIFDRYGCTTGLCHGGNQDVIQNSGLQLLPASEPGALETNYQTLLNAAPPGDYFADHYVVKGDPKSSLLYQALFKKTHDCSSNPDLEGCDGIAGAVQGMPQGATITVPELEAVALWLRGGAPSDLVVAGTADRLDSCLPPADPLKIDPPPVPGPGNGVQFVSGAWSLPHDSENEVCFPIYYDFTQTTLIPEDQQFDCPGTFGPLNPSGKCFRYHKQLLLQDPQSHHSIIHIYTGVADTDDNGWDDPNVGPDDPTGDSVWWTYKLNDVTDPLNGTECDPKAVDPATGLNTGCSGDPVRTAACLTYGPSDFNTGGFLPGQTTAPQFSGSQETHYEQEFADGVYSILPMQGIIVFNSHAFNLTPGDTTMNQYLNLWLAGASDQQYQTQQIFDADNIFIQEVPPFQTREYCAPFVIPQGANLFWLSSHTHRHGVRWRTWGPPNDPCDAGEAGPGTPSTNCQPGPADQLMYHSSVYNDPVQLAIDPPLVFNGSARDRRFIFCSFYDNGSTPTSPSVKRRSTSPTPPFPYGGPCGDGTVACANDGPKKGQLCGTQPDPDRFCDSSPGLFDGLCDACTLRGGFTTEDEMFIKLGNFFITP